MEGVQNLIEFLEMIVNVMSLLTGLLIGIFATASVPAVYRAYRRAVLRRRWRADKPGTIREGLFPEWQDYEPDIPGIAKRCVCHNRRIHPGERVLTWPETGPGNLLHVAVYCESTKEQMWRAR